jgi:CBS domain containing-hemolysin-like protein
VILLQLLAIALLVRAQRFFVARDFAIVKARSSQFAALTAQGNRRARG